MYTLLSSGRIKSQSISAATEGTWKIFRLGYVEVEKLPNLSEVGFPVTRSQRTKNLYQGYLGKGGMLDYFLDIMSPLSSSFRHVASPRVQGSWHGQS